MNPHLDAVPLTHAGRTATVCFTWRALEVLQRDWGRKEWAARFAEALQDEHIGDMAEVLALTTGMNVDEVRDWMPPTAITAQALWDAYAMTKLGQKEKPAASGDVDDTENPLKAQSILSRAFAVWRSAQAWAGPNFGKAPPTPPA